MGWAATYIKRLKRGEQVSFRPVGNSMEPIIKSGQLVVIKPVRVMDLKVGDVVLCKCKNNDYLHLVKDIDRERNRYQIGNNRGGINGWIGPWAIYGRLDSVSD